MYGYDRESTASSGRKSAPRTAGYARRDTLERYARAYDSWLREWEKERGRSGVRENLAALMEEYYGSSDDGMTADDWDKIAMLYTAKYRKAYGSHDDYDRYSDSKSRSAESKSESRYSKYMDSYDDLLAMYGGDEAVENKASFYAQLQSEYARRSRRSDL